MIDDRLPRPDIEVSVLLPYTRGDLLARMHAAGEVLETRHTERRLCRHRAGQRRPGRRPGAVLSDA